MEEKNIERQLVVRIFGSSIDEVKAAVKKAAGLAGVSPALFGRDNEYLINITVAVKGEAAAQELCESAASIIEKALNDDVYARGDITLAGVTVSALIKSGTQLCAANSELGALLEDEFKGVSGAEQIFDFGEYTYNNIKKKTVLNPKTIAKYGASSQKAAALLAEKARKAAKVRYGAAFSAADETGRRWVAVADNGKLYARQMQNDESPRAAALAALDLVRRLSIGAGTESTEPVVKLKAVRKINRFAAAAAVVSLALSFAAAAGLYYAYDNYYQENNSPKSSINAFK